MSDKGYNGWKNYETWNVALWIDNDQGSYSTRCGMAQDAYDNAEAARSFTRLERAALDLAETLKDWFEDQNPLASEASCFSDLLSAALGEVDWYEIAENFLEDVDKDDPDEDEEDDTDDDDPEEDTLASGQGSHAPTP